MLQRDYLMRLLGVFFQALVKSWEKEKDKDPLLAAATLEEAISQATDIDGAVLLSLAPESMTSILQVSGTDPRVIEYIANSLKLESEYLAMGGNDSLSQLRLSQAETLAASYGVELAASAQEFIDNASAAVKNIDADE